MRPLIVLFLGLAATTSVLAASVLGQEDILDPEKAFRFSARALDERTIEVRYRIEDGYYLYRDKFRFAAEPPTVKLGTAAFPPGRIKQDEFFGRVETYRGSLAIRVPVEPGAEKVDLAVTSQGCADVGICYPPITQRAEIVLAGLSSTIGGGVSPFTSMAPSSPAVSGSSTDADVNAGQFVGRPVRGQLAAISDESTAANVLAGGSLWAVCGFFFLAGLLLTFTPCVLPMIPILSGIIVGEGREAHDKGRALALSLAYVAGMAVAYTALGVAAGLAGSMFGGALQNPWVLTAFAAIFVLLAFSMFGFYDLALPSFLHTKLTHASNRLTGGHVGAVVLMGALSAAIVSPCVAAPLAGALVYISQSRDVFLGGTALFSMAIGMGVPLVVVGVTEGALLPRSGHWMKSVKKFFGFLMLGVAIWVVAPIVPVVVQMLLWAALLIVGAMYLHALDPLPHEASDIATSFSRLRAFVPQPVPERPVPSCASSGCGRSPSSTRGSRRPVLPSCSTSMPTGASRARRWNGSRSAMRACATSSVPWSCCRWTSPRTTSTTRRCSSASTSSGHPESSSSIARAGKFPTCA
jgi:thiol:disulfide interchange protein DsbD